MSSSKNLSYKPDSAPQKLINAARVCLIDKGHAHCSVKVIAAEAGVNHGLVHHYFGSKEGLYAALVEQLREGGKMVIPVGDQHLQVLQLLEKGEDGVQVRELEKVRFVDLVGEHGWK